MAGAAVLGSTVQVLLQKLLEVSFDDIKNVFGYKEEVTKLQKSLAVVQKFLSDAEKKEINDGSVKEWLQELEDVSFEADAILDEFSYQLLRQKVKNQNQKNEKVLSSFSSVSSNFVVGRKVAHKMRDLNEKLEKINKDAVSYGLQTAVASAQHASTAAHVKTDSFYVEPNFVGRENDVEKIVEMLVNASPTEALHVIHIFGMGGLGKTTLARNIYNHEKIEAHFEKKFWVCVPVDFDAETLFKMILESLTGESVQGFLAKQTILEKIQKLLKKKRYLLFLDDIWNEEIKKWEDFIGSLSGITSQSGNCILVTTRKEVIASNVKTLYTHRLDNLSENDCWSIIKAQALSGVDNQEEYEETRECIAQWCGGLPLAATVVGGFLQGKQKDEWLGLLKSQSLDFGQSDNHVFQILKLSYDHLPSSSLKRCFAYFSVFPKHTVISRTHIVWLWMAEGFLQGDQKNDMEVVGDGYFEHLVHSSLLQVVERDVFGNITSFRVHSLVHDLACSISGTRSLHEGGRQSNDMQHVRYLTQNSGDPCFISVERAMFLRSFFFTGKVANKFSDFSCLHTFTLVSPYLQELPIEIEKLIHLRFLNIYETSINYLPDSICKLLNLQTLFAPQYLIVFPNKFTELICLRHLLFPPITVPPGIGRLTSLQTLTYFKVGVKKGCGIGELKTLENLKGKLEIQNLERVKHKTEVERADLFGKRNVYSLVLRWNISSDEINDEKVLEGLQPQPNLKSLEIGGFQGNNFPMWIMKMEVHDDIGSCWVKLKNLTQIKFTGCQRCEEIPMVGHLPHLKFLELNNLPNVRSIRHSFYGNENSSNTSTMSSYINFPALEQLKLLDMPNLTDWVDAEGEAVVFPCLSYIEIKSCQQLDNVPCHFPRIEELHLENLNEDFPLSNVCSNTSSLQKVDIRKLPGLIHLPAGLFVKNEKMWYLKIKYCPKLTRLVPSLLGGGASLRELEINDCESLSELLDDLDTLHSLEKLIIFSCPKLKSIPSVREGSQGLKSLQKLDISFCRELSNLASEILESCKSTLSSLSLFDLENLETASVISCLPRLSCLTDLTLCHLPKLVTFPTEVSRNLRDLIIGGYSSSSSSSSSKSIDEVSFTHNLNRILQHLHHLEDLWLFGNEDWNSLSAVDTQHLTNLRSLLLEGFGIEALPEWIGNISSLQELTIYSCKRLKHMPSKEAMQRLTKLFVLQIVNCPLMKESFTSSDDDSERAKVSHIQKVKVDREPFTRRDDEWLALLQSQSLDFGRNENHVTKILRLSYDNLPSSSIKKCFAYCSVLPPHILIYSVQMIRLWMAEGFLQADRRNDMEAVGDSYFEHLLQSSLFQDVKRDNFGNIIHCRMHSFVHELACSVTGSSSIRYLTKHSVDRYSGEESKLLRSFYLIDAKAAPNFSAFSSLHSLTLSSSRIEVLPAEIEKLIHLRLLDVENTSSRCLPDSICKLFNYRKIWSDYTLSIRSGNFKNFIDQHDNSNLTCLSINNRGLTLIAILSPEPILPQQILTARQFAPLYIQALRDPLAPLQANSNPRANPGCQLSPRTLVSTRVPLPIRMLGDSSFKM